LIQSAGEIRKIHWANVPRKEKIGGARIHFFINSLWEE
jgi:hypothetical protein